MVICQFIIYSRSGVVQVLSDRYDRGGGTSLRLKLAEDLRHNYIHCLESRVRETAVGWAHVTATAVGAFLTVFLGYLLCYGLLALRFPLIGELEMEEILRLGQMDMKDGFIMDSLFCIF